jgi:nitrite reductase (cytochrome c-552)
MVNEIEPRQGRWRSWLLYLATIAITAAATYGVVALLMNINERKEEAKQHYLKLVELNSTKT